MKIILHDLSSQIASATKSEVPQTIRSLCETEYETHEAALAALSQIRFFYSTGVDIHRITPEAYSHCLQLVDQKIQSLDVFAKGSEMSQTVSGEGGEEFQLLTLPIELLDQIMKETGGESYKAAEVCKDLKETLDGFNLHQARRLHHIDASSGFLSNLGLTLPKTLTAVNASNALKKVCQTIIIIFRFILEESMSMTRARELVQEPHTLKEILLEDPGLLRYCLEILAEVPEEASIDERKERLENWLHESDLGLLISTHTFPHPALTPKLGMMPELSLSEGGQEDTNGALAAFFNGLDGHSLFS